MFNGIIQIILMAFSIKRPRAFTCMLLSENYDFKFLQSEKNIKSTCNTCTIVPVLVELLLSLQSSLSLTRNMNVKVAI